MSAQGHDDSTPVKSDKNGDNDFMIKIHVCDEASNSKKDFECWPKLLFAEMQYFAGTIRNENLKNINISVYCDISIFEWLLDWAQCEHYHKSNDNYPILTNDNLVQILVSASFLQMKHLVEIALLYFHRNINDILRKSISLNCLNNDQYDRLAKTFTNLQLETITDKRDKVLSKLYCTFIRDLCGNDAEPIRGHWYSYSDASTYCKYCKKFLLHNAKVSCTYERTKALKNGRLRTKQHEIDQSFEIDKFINQMKSEMKNWRSTYWRLWGYFHWLFCSFCKKVFPAYQLNWCSYHPGTPEYQKATGCHYYPCCNNKYYENSEMNSLSGCQCRPHCIILRKVADESILKTLMQMKSIILENPPKFCDNNSSGYFSSASSSTTVDEIMNQNKEIYNSIKIERIIAASSIDEETSEEKRAYNLAQYEDNSNSSATTLSSDDDIFKLNSCSRKYTWNPLLSVRVNQDIQREHEDELFKKIGDSIIQKLTVTQKHIKKETISGGMYAKIYTEWYEKHQPPTKTKTFKNG